VKPWEPPAEKSEKSPEYGSKEWFAKTAQQTPEQFCSFEHKTKLDEELYQGCLKNAPWHIKNAQHVVLGPTSGADLLVLARDDVELEVRNAAGAVEGLNLLARWRLWGAGSPHRARFYANR
jgi:hypothetical protein